MKSSLYNSGFFHCSIFFFQLLFFGTQKNTEELRTHREIFVHLRKVRKGRETNWENNLGFGYVWMRKEKVKQTTVSHQKKQTRFLHFWGGILLQPMFLGLKTIIVHGLGVV